jgi:hypothetical protein
MPPAIEVEDIGFDAPAGAVLARPTGFEHSFVLLPGEMAMMTFVNLPVTVVADTRCAPMRLGKR